MKSSKIKFGQVNDTMRIKDGTTSRVETPLTSGKRGRDIMDIETNWLIRKTKLIISKFGKKGTLIVGHATFNLDNIDDPAKFIELDA